MTHMHRVFVYPKPENIDEVRTMFVERIKSRQAIGVRAEFAELVEGAEIPQFTVSTLYKDTAAFETMRQWYQSDAESQRFVAKLETLIREPTASDLLKVLVPMPK